MSHILNFNLVSDYLTVLQLLFSLSHYCYRRSTNDNFDFDTRPQRSSVWRRVAKRTFLYFVLWNLEQCIAYIPLLYPESVSELNWMSQYVDPGGYMATVLVAERELADKGKEKAVSVSFHLRT
jgi:hypothetical protein